MRKPFCPHVLVSLCCLVLPLLCVCSQALAQEPFLPLTSGQQRQRAVEQRFQPLQRLERFRTPGLSVAVFTARGLDWSAGYGVTTSQGAPVTPQTLFQAASVSKVVAAACALRLVARERISLDEPVNPRLFSWKLPNRFGAPLPPVTLRQLLSHTGGVNVPGFPGYARWAPLPDLLQILQGQPPTLTPPVAVTLFPGSGFHYSGGGYTVIQKLLQDLSGLPYAAVARELVLAPCGMEHSGFHMPDKGLRKTALAHDARGALLPGGFRLYPELAAAGLWSTAPDLARLGRALCLGAAGSRRPPLSPAWARSMFRQQLQDGGLGMGLGIFVRTGEETIVFHEGSNTGYKSLLLLLPQRRQGLAAMTNAENGRGLLLELLGAVAEVYGWPDLATPFLQDAPQDARHEAAMSHAALLSKASKEYGGLWRDAHGAQLRILPHAEGLGLQLFEGMLPAPLSPSPAAEDGRVLELVLNDPLDPLILRRQGEVLLMERQLFQNSRYRRVE